LEGEKMIKEKEKIKEQYKSTAKPGARVMPFIKMLC
jgi:hypothetical protein